MLLNEKKIRIKKGRSGNLGGGRGGTNQTENKI